VQVGDPFQGEVVAGSLLDYSLAGCCWNSRHGSGRPDLLHLRTASRAGSGIEIDLAKVPKRESGMTPYEVLLSESQERMLIIARHGKERRCA